MSATEAQVEGPRTQGDFKKGLIGMPAHWFDFGKVVGVISAR